MISVSWKGFEFGKVSSEYEMTMGFKWTDYAQPTIVFSLQLREKEAPKFFSNWMLTHDFIQFDFSPHWPF